MKKTFISFIFASLMMHQGLFAQALSVSADWPNTAWTIDTVHTGTNPMDIEANPAVSDHFAYDDDDTGNGSHDEIAAISPVIDLTAAQNAGENYIIITGDYVYNRFVYAQNEKLSIDYWDADASTWVTFYEFPDEDTPNAPNDNYCSGEFVHYAASLDISGFSAAQLTAFKYRLFYSDDTTGGNGYNYGFCFSSPVLFSSASVYSLPEFETTINPDCSNAQFSVDVNVTDLGGASSVTVTDDQGSNPQQLTAPGTVSFGPYPDQSTIVFSVVNNDNPVFTSSQSVSFYCPPPNDSCAFATPIAALPFIDTLNASGATNNGGFIDCNGEGMNDGVWYVMTVESATDTIHIMINPVDWDAELGVYTGDCNQLNCIAHADDGILGDPEVVEFFPTDSTTYYINVGHWSQSDDEPEGEFTIEITGNVTIHTPELTATEFSLYPNPAEDDLFFKAGKAVEKLEILSPTGQLLATYRNVYPGNTLNISFLNKGVYLVRVQLSGKTGIFKLIKK